VKVERVVINLTNLPRQPAHLGRCALRRRSRRQR
jgi:hypothetical protein